MNGVGIVLVLFGTGYLLYSIIFRKKVTLYFNSVKILPGKEKEFLKLQLILSVFNSIWMMALGLVVIKYDCKNSILFILPVIFAFANLLMKIVSRKKGYIKLW